MTTLWWRGRHGDDGSAIYDAYLSVLERLNYERLYYKPRVIYLSPQAEYSISK
ncbi:tRNA (guanine37-N1) -methyltransferase [Acetivibrio straminisolvens JCM 21531]|uniref:tRNA (Guanine37-N1)-methyltransferase n=1 Tax=Acetivibrio straminisolvens JCM 21531 TaxID=1294263 RepID=W4V9A7_9FIRM|nr:tRNA (guanine37-N1) -methyltransferase [Acetivibrio straminisolvens JCM 21531]